MRRHSLIFVLALLSAHVAAAQVTDATVCDILANPSNFDGKVVRVKATVAAGFDEFIIKGASCGLPVNAIWLSYPEGTKGKAGPVATLELRTAANGSATIAAFTASDVKLDRNKDFLSFDSYLSTPVKMKGVCPGCVKYTVTATLTGRINAAKNEPVVRSGGKITAINGFGNLDLYPAQLELQSVAEVTPQEIDYTKNPSAQKDDSGNSGGGDPVAAAHQAAKAFAAGSLQAEDLEAAAAAYGKEGEDNGVIVGFGGSNEMHPDERTKGKGASPDGILYIATFDMDRLKGAALSEAMSHLGSEIADLRSTKASDADLLALETKAWKVTVLSAVARNQKTLTAPGGYVLWNSTWPQADTGRLASEGFTAYLHDWAALGK